MQTWRIITALALVAAMPMAWASNPAGCEDAKREETAVSPLNSEVYILIDAEDTDKTGFWRDANGVPGLQTQACQADDGAPIYDADERADGILLS